MKLFVLNRILYNRKVVQRVLVLKALVLSAFVKTGILNKLWHELAELNCGDSN